MSWRRRGATTLQVDQADAVTVDGRSIVSVLDYGVVELSAGRHRVVLRVVDPALASRSLHIEGG